LDTKLELASYPVKNVCFNKQTRYHKGSLEINKSELISLLKEDRRIASIDVDIAFPGEKTRIVMIRDAVEPRIKVTGSGNVFPGLLGPVESVGTGRTNRLSGIAVIPSAQYEPTIITGNNTANSGTVDMWGPGAVITPFSSTINVVPVMKLVDDVSELDAHTAILMAELKTARYLAETTQNMEPANIEGFELFKVDDSLPKVIYILSFMSLVYNPHSFVAYYGFCLHDIMPFLIRPQELLDGVITTDTRQGHGRKPTTWHWMNHPVVLNLFREHGRRLNFLGLIMQRTRFESELGKHISATCTSEMAKLLGADGVIITRTTGSGANFEDVVMTLQACEKKGIKTVLLNPEWGSADGSEPPLIIYVPEATAMVSTGSHEAELKLPKPAKVIGVEQGQMVIPEPGGQPFSPWSEIEWNSYYPVTGAPDWFGSWNLMAEEY
jgi:glycine reductase